jgi:hypothetical protein
MLKGHVPAWASVVKAGIFICSENRPPLIPKNERGYLDSGGLPTGTEVTLNTAAVHALGVNKLLVTIPAVVKGCTTSALKKMSATPGMLLMTDTTASFAEKGQLVQVLLK